MARRRTLKAEVFEHDGLSDLSRDCRLLFIGMWPRADKSGRLPDRPKRIKGWVFPHDCDLGGEIVDEMLWLLAEHAEGFIVRYEVDGERFIQIRAWDAHQNPHHNEPESEIPELHNGQVLVRDESRIKAGCIDDESSMNTTKEQRPRTKDQRPRNKEQDPTNKDQGARKGGAGGKPRRSTRVPDDFDLSDDRRAFAVETGVPNVDREWEKFRDCEFKPPGHTDWAAAWRRWCRRAVELGTRDTPGESRGGGNLTAAEKTIDASRRVMARAEQRQAEREAREAAERGIL